MLHGRYCCWGALVAVGVYDLRQQKRAILRNYPLIGNLRFVLEHIRPEIRQYFMESDTEAASFSRAQRSLVYQRAKGKGQTDYRPFGSQVDVKEDGYEWINHSMTLTRLDSHDFRITIGTQRRGREPRPGDCRLPYEANVFNISAMSFAKNATDPQVEMIEIKLSQRAKPGQGGVVPGGKVTAEIAAARGIPVGKTCVSPPIHSAFSSPLELLQFIERLRELSGGKPVGFKFCLGHPWEWFGIVKAMMETDITPDFIVVDGSEVGTGASLVELIDHVGVPLQEALLLIHNTLVGADLRDRVKLGCAGKVICAFDVVRMLALVVSNKTQRVYQFHDSTLLAFKYLIQAAGLQHPNEIQPHHIVRRIDENNVRLLSNLLPQVARGALLKDDLSSEHHIYRHYWKQSCIDRFGMAVN